jgi:hypothetical protein
VLGVTLGLIAVGWWFISPKVTRLHPNFNSFFSVQCSFNEGYSAWVHDILANITTNEEWPLTLYSGAEGVLCDHGEGH